MPNRLLRPGINKSKRIAALSFPAEVFYRRLMSHVDDYGRCEYDPALMITDLYPLQIGMVSVAKIEDWVDECTMVQQLETEALVVKYSVGKKTYLQMNNFGQRLRSKKSLCPGPVDTCPPPAVMCPPPAVICQSSAAHATPPTPTPSPSSASGGDGGGEAAAPAASLSAKEWPETATAVRRRFIHAQNSVIIAILGKSLRVKPSANDNEIACAVEETWFHGQKTPHWWIDRVPEYLLAPPEQRGQSPGPRLVRARASPTRAEINQKLIDDYFRETTAG